MADTDTDEKTPAAARQENASRREQLRNWHTAPIQEQIDTQLREAGLAL